MVLLILKLIHIHKLDSGLVNMGHAEIASGVETFGRLVSVFNIF